jgi:hypothetical protein
MKAKRGGKTKAEKKGIRQGKRKNEVKKERAKHREEKTALLGKLLPRAQSMKLAQLARRFLNLLSRLMASFGAVSAIKTLTKRFAVTVMRKDICEWRKNVMKQTVRSSS